MSIKRKSKKSKQVATYFPLFNFLYLPLSTSYTSPQHSTGLILLPPKLELQFYKQISYMNELNSPIHHKRTMKNPQHTQNLSLSYAFCCIFSTAFLNTVR